jgi:hypothetical protein
MIAQHRGRFLNLANTLESRMKSGPIKAKAARADRLGPVVHASNWRLLTLRPLSASGLIIGLAMVRPLGCVAPGVLYLGVSPC